MEAKAGPHHPNGTNTKKQSAALELNVPQIGGLSLFPVSFAQATKPPVAIPYRAGEPQGKQDSSEGLSNKVTTWFSRRSRQARKNSRDQAVPATQVAAQSPAPKSSPVQRKARPTTPVPVKTEYKSKDIEIPESFLTVDPPDARPIVSSVVRFEETDLPEYEGRYAVVLDHVLSPSECDDLLDLAELSAGAGDEGVENDGWAPAMVNIGQGMEILQVDYRNSDRIIWDSAEIVRRIWDRCAQAEDVKNDLWAVEGNESILGRKAVKEGVSWDFTKVNPRMRFLRYGKGQFFKEHCDSTYVDPETHERTFYTVHLYLNDSIQAYTATNKPPPPPVDLTKSEPLPDPAAPADDSDNEPLSGGATTFHSRDLKRYLDVDPKAGRVLIFQHQGLLHSGDEVLSGVKYTMRTELMYERNEPEGEGDGGAGASRDYHRALARGGPK